MNNDKQAGKKAGEETKIYLTPDSTLQTPDEHRHDQTVDPRKDETISVSRDDLNETETDRYRNRATGSGEPGNDL